MIEMKDDKNETDDETSKDDDERMREFASRLKRPMDMYRNAGKIKRYFGFDDSELPEAQQKQDDTDKEPAEQFFNGMLNRIKNFEIEEENYSLIKSSTCAYNKEKKVMLELEKNSTHINCLDKKTDSAQCKTCYLNESARAGNDAIPLSNTDNTILKAGICSWDENRRVIFEHKKNTLIATCTESDMSDACKKCIYNEKSRSELYQKYKKHL